MKKECENYNHLCRMPNTKKNREMIETMRKLIKVSESRWQLVLRGRHPIKGHKYGYGGSLPLKYAKSFSVYVILKKSVKEKINRQKYKRIMQDRIYNNGIRPKYENQRNALHQIRDTIGRLLDG